MVKVLVLVSCLAGAAAAQPALDSPQPVKLAAAPAEPWSFAVAPRVGVTVPTSKLGAFVIGGVELDYAATPRLLVAADVSLTRPGFDGTVMDDRIANGSGTFAVHEAELVVGVLALVRLAPPHGKLVPWLGGGPVVQMLKTTETTSLAPGANTATSTELGIEIGGGIDVRAGPGYVTGSLRAVYSKLDHTLTGSTNAGNVALAAGYRIVF
jgi:hypothetical protein